MKNMPMLTEADAAMVRMGAYIVHLETALAAVRQRIAELEKEIASAETLAANRDGEKPEAPAD